MGCVPFCVINKNICVSSIIGDRITFFPGEEKKNKVFHGDTGIAVRFCPSLQHKETWGTGATRPCPYFLALTLHVYKQTV